MNRRRVGYDGDTCAVRQRAQLVGWCRPTTKRSAVDDCTAPKTVRAQPPRKRPRLVRKATDAPPPLCHNQHAGDSLWSRLPLELLDAILNGPHGIGAVHRGVARLVCRAWRDSVASVSDTDRRRFAASTPSGFDSRTWSDGRCVAASVLAPWSSPIESPSSPPPPPPPSSPYPTTPHPSMARTQAMPAVNGGVSVPSKALAQARLVCESVTIVQIAAGVAMIDCCGGVPAAMAMVGAVSVLPQLSAPLHSRDINSDSAHERQNLHGDTSSMMVGAVRRRCFTVLSPCHAVAMLVAAAAGSCGVGATGAVMALAQASSLPSVLAQMETAVAHDRPASALSLVGVAVARLYAQRMSPASAVESVLHRVWFAITQHDAVITARWLASAINVERPPPAAAEPPSAGSDSTTREVHRALGDWAWDMVASWGRAPSTDWSCAAARLGRTRLLQIARRRAWPLNALHAFTAALCSGQIKACQLIVDWHAEDNDGQFGPLTCDRAVNMLLYAASSRLCSDDVFARALAWLASFAPIDSAPVQSLSQVLAPWPVLSEAAALVDTWPVAVVQLGHVRGGVAAYVEAARWGSADALVALAIKESPDPSLPPVTQHGFALWEPWVTRLAERVSYSRPDEDGGTASVEILAVLCALALRAGLIHSRDAPSAAAQILGDEAFASRRQCDTAVTTVWSDAVRPVPLTLSLALAVRALATNDPRPAVRINTTALARWLVRGGLCADVFGEADAV